MNHIYNSPLKVKRDNKLANNNRVASPYQQELASDVELGGSDLSNFFTEKEKIAAANAARERIRYQCNYPRKTSLPTHKPKTAGTMGSIMMDGDEFMLVAVKGEKTCNDETSTVR